MALKELLVLSIIATLIQEIHTKHPHHNHTHTKKPHHHHPRATEDPVVQQNRCKVNEVLTNCTCQYEIHCGNKDTVECFGGCQPPTEVCECISGYIKDYKTKICIPIDKCPKSVCEPDEVFNPCGVCETPCQKLDDPVVCAAVCDYNGGCACKKDLIRDLKTGRCVPLEKCPNDHPCNV